ncbi:ubiquitin carboxyl-terminal hydrolase [Aphelenchoides avenae]|nr:ubiquitin carboxyl-terminal hydrolase [Aphelenchus avenae]
MSETKAQVQWLPLESNPDAMNKFLEKIGIRGVSCTDVYGFDDELLEFIPKPHLALVLCFPNYRQVDAMMKPVYD